VRLRRYVYAPMLLLALWAVVLVVSPAVAEAQGIARAKDAQKGSERIVVRPGASLWSISEERLGPNATPQQIANAAERIYALNRSQIGADPNLIFPGQKLSVPPVVGNPSTAEPSTGTTAARGATEPTEASPTARVANSGTTDRASRTPSGAAEGKGEKASNPVAEPVNLPEVAAAAPVPAVRSLDAKASPRSPVESFAKTVRSAVSSAESAVVGAFPRGDYPGRKLLGLGTIVLTLIVCGLMAWKLPMRRNVGDYAAWGIPGGYPNYRTHPKALDRYADASAAQVSPTGFVPKQRLESSDDEVTMAENNDLGRVGIVGAVRGRRERLRRRRPSKQTGRRQAPRPRRPSHQGSATGAYSPKIYRALSRAALETRPQRSANGRAKATRQGGAPSARALLTKPEIVGNGRKTPLRLVVNEESRPYQRIHLLSARQREVLELAAEGLPNAQIARRLFVTESTVKQHLYKAYKTLGVRNRREAAKFLSSNDGAERRPVTAGWVRP
jgi:DNA-binding CsgD family transcriptional regulator/LysM repeat protein